jgi:putative (di)nucleoside polyphosphate hydrolase
MPATARDLPYRPCVGIMLINEDGLVWIGRRADSPQENEGPGHWWQMPQGGIDKGEAPDEAALRELAEETSVRSARIAGEIPGWLYYDLPEHLVGVAWKGRYRGQKQKWFAARFEGDDSEVNILAPDGGHKAEFDAWKWVRPDELVDLIVPFKRDVYAKVVAGFAHLTG